MQITNATYQYPMQNRHLDRRSYFNELATTSENYYIPYLEKHIKLRPGMKILEIGCGEGGNLEPFAEKGCEVTGVDIVKERTEQAKTFFAQDGVPGTFICNDASKCSDEFNGKFDIVLAHDVIEHVPDKLGFLSAARRFLRPGGFAFFRFPRMVHAFRRTPTDMSQQILLACPVFTPASPAALQNYSGKLQRKGKRRVGTDGHTRNTHNHRTFRQNGTQSRVLNRKPTLLVH